MHTLRACGWPLYWQTPCWAGMSTRFSDEVPTRLGRGRGRRRLKSTSLSQTGAFSPSLPHSLHTAPPVSAADFSATVARATPLPSHWPTVVLPPTRPRPPPRPRHRHFLMAADRQWRRHISAGVPPTTKRATPLSHRGPTAVLYLTHAPPPRYRGCSGHRARNPRAHGTHHVPTDGWRLCGEGGPSSHGAPRAWRQPAGKAPFGLWVKPASEAVGAWARGGAAVWRKDSTTGSADAWRVLSVGEPSLDEGLGNAGRESPVGGRRHCGKLRGHMPKDKHC